MGETGGWMPDAMVKGNEDGGCARPARRSASAASRVGFAKTRTAREVEVDVEPSNPVSESDRARSARWSGERAKRAETEAR